MSKSPKSKAIVKKDPDLVENKFSESKKHGCRINTVGECVFKFPTGWQMMSFIRDVKKTDDNFVVTGKLMTMLTLEGNVDDLNMFEMMCCHDWGLKLIARVSRSSNPKS